MGRMTDTPSSPAAESKLGLGLIFGVIMGLAAGVVLERFGAPYPASHIAGFLASVAFGLAVGQLLTIRSRKTAAPPEEESNVTTT